MRHLPAALAALLCAAAPAGDGPTLQVVKYPELTRVVRGLQGKVVVVDFWGEF